MIKISNIAGRLLHTSKMKDADTALSEYVIAAGYQGIEDAEARRFIASDRITIEEVKEEEGQ